jgi:hypothetical protein
MNHKKKPEEDRMMTHDTSFLVFACHQVAAGRPSLGQGPRLFMSSPCARRSVKSMEAKNGLCAQHGEKTRIF